MDKAIELLKKTVSIYSTSGNERKVSEFLVKEMNKLGFKAYRDKAGNAIGEVGSGKKTILMLGHIDTVPGEIPVRIKDNKLYGRGSVDAKGSFCAFIIAASNIKDKKIILVGAVEEECPTSKGARFILDKYNPDFIIIGEPSGYDAITIGYKGRLMVDCFLEREMSHGASQDRGVIEDAFNFYTALRDNVSVFNSDKFGVFNEVRINIQSINSGSDGFKQSVKMTLGYRLPVNYDVENLKNFIKKVKGKAEIKIYGWEKSIKAGKNNDLVKAFLKSIRNNGLKPKFKVKSGTSDMNILGEAFPNIPILAYGPGDSSLDHTPNEHIDLDEYKKAIEILKEVLENIS